MARRHCRMRIVSPEDPPMAYPFFALPYFAMK